MSRYTSSQIILKILILKKSENEDVSNRFGDSTSKINVTLGVLSNPISFIELKAIRDKLLLEKDVVRFESGNPLSSHRKFKFNEDNSGEVLRKILKNLSKFTYASTSYTKQFFGDHFFDFLEELKVKFIFEYCWIWQL